MYELLQISPKARRDAIHRVYRFLAARYHPDNPDTGDPERFVLIRLAVEILSDPQRRAAYDLARQMEKAQAVPMSASVDFMDGMEGETNRRLALLSVLCNQVLAESVDVAGVSDSGVLWREWNWHSVSLMGSFRKGGRTSTARA